MPAITSLTEAHVPVVEQSRPSTFLPPQARQIGSIENGVLIGRNGFLFLAGGAHAVFEIVTGTRQISEHSYGVFSKEYCIESSLGQGQ